MRNEQQYLNIINNLSDGVYLVDLKRKINFWNKAAEEITGYTSEEVVGRNCEDNLLNHIDSEGRPLCLVGCPLYATMIDEKQRKEEVFLRHKKGHRIPIFVNIFPIYEDNKVVGAAEIFTPHSPVTYKDDLVEKLSNMAMKDALTEIPNRKYLESFLDYKLNEYKRFNSSFAVLFLDIDNFRDFNNTYGHDVGDLVLKNVAKSCQKHTRKSDMFGRWGGEEFVGIYAIKEDYEASIIAEKVRMLIENTEIMNGETRLSVTASIGITVNKQDDNQETIVERADHLMYDSKEKGKNCVSVD